MKRHRLCLSFLAIALIVILGSLSRAQHIPFNYWKNRLPTAPPNAPTNLVAIETTTTTIELGWDDNSDNEANFQLQWCEGSGCSSFVDLPDNPLAVNTVSYLKLSLLPGRTFRFRVRAQNIIGDSGWATSADISTSNSAPLPPTNFQVISKGRYNIYFRFQDNSSVEDDFDVQMCQGAGCSGWANVSASPLAATENTYVYHSESSLTANTTYRFRVRASNATGDSAWLESSDITTEDGVDGSTSLVQASSANMPNDDSAYVTIFVKLLSSTGATLSDETVEVSATTGTATLSGAGACRVPAGTCATATNVYRGWYRVTAKTATANTVTFSAVVVDTPDVNITQTAQTNFDTANFTVFSAGGTVTSGNAGQNLYFSGGTSTFNATAVGQSYGDIVVNGGVINHAAATAGTYYKIDISADSFNINTGGVNLNNLGFDEVTNNLNTGYTTSPTVPSSALGGTSGAYVAGSHGGFGGRRTCCTGGTPNPVYDNFRDPYLPGASDAHYNKNGGGSFRLVSTGTCTIDSGGYIYANGEAHGGAGGTINLRCASIGGTAGNNALQANGGNGQNHSSLGGGGGGGGRIALVSSGDHGSFIYNLRYPTNKGSADNILNKIEAKGGTGVSVGSWHYGHGGAGTIYFEASDIPDGTLLASNEMITHEKQWNDVGYTKIEGFYGTINGSHSAGTSNISLNLTAPAGSLSANHTDFYKGHNIRIEKGVSNDWSDDEFYLITGNDTSSVDIASTLSNSLLGGENYRTAIVLDSIYITGGVDLKISSDLYIKNGSLEDYGGINMPIYNAVITKLDGADVKWDQQGKVEITLASGTFFFQDPLSTNYHINLNGGNTYINAINIDYDIVGNGGTWSIPTMSTNGNFFINSGTTITTNTLTSDNAVIYGGTLSTESITTGEYIQSGGVVTHKIATASLYYKLNMTVDSLVMTGGGINLDAKGFDEVTNNLNTGYTTSPTVPSSALGGTSGAYVAGSHGGYGGRRKCCTSGTPNPVYDNFRDPYLPGASDAHYNKNGGGALLLTSSGTCTINNGAYITADGEAHGGAGGTINLKCSGFAGTAGANAIRARGGNGTNHSSLGGGGGGGGRIAFISSGAKSSFSGNFAYPTNKASADAFLALADTRGGTGVSVGSWHYGHGGAGTIYLQASDAPNGTLLISNKWITHEKSWDNIGYTMIEGFYGTVNGAHSGGATNVSLNLTAPAGALSADHADFYKGHNIRIEKGAIGDWSDDEMHLITGNDTSSVDLATGLSGGLSDGDNYRTLIVLDSLYITGGAELRTYSDIYVENGSLEDYAGFNFPITDGMITKLNGAEVKWGGGGAVQISLTSGTFYFQKEVSSDFHLSLSGGNTYIYNYSSPVDMSITGGTWYISQMLDVNGDLTMSNGSVTSKVADADNITLSGGTLSTESITTGTYLQNGGTLTHRVGTNTNYYKLEMSASSFTLNSGSVDVSAKGFAEVTNNLNTGYTSSDTIPSSALGGTSGSDVAGSHGGSGGRQTTASGTTNPTYDNFRDPYLPGASDADQDLKGGGAFLLTSSGACTINSGSSILANGQAGGGAGGTINLKCPSFSGTAAAGAIQARGGNGLNASSLQGGGGGGGRIAFISSGAKSSFTGSFAYPTDAGTLATWLDLATARGGNGVTSGSWRYGHGGAGTVYLQASDVPKGSLIVSNKGLTLSGYAYPTSGRTPLLAATDNGSTLYNDLSTNEAEITNGGTPYTNMIDYFKDHEIHLWNTGSGNPDPLDGSHTSVVLDDGNTNNSFKTTAGSIPTIANDHSYRFVYDVQHLYVGYNADVQFQGADLIVNECDITNSSSTTFTVPAGSSITGNSFASPVCLDASVSTKGSTVNFTNYYLP